MECARAGLCVVATHAQPETFVAFRVRTVMKTWSRVEGTRVASEDVYLRDP